MYTAVVSELIVSAKILLVYCCCIWVDSAKDTACTLLLYLSCYSGVASIATLPFQACLHFTALINQGHPVIYVVWLSFPAHWHAYAKLSTQKQGSQLKSCIMGGTHPYFSFINKMMNGPWKLLKVTTPVFMLKIWYF